MRCEEEEEGMSQPKNVFPQLGLVVPTLHINNGVVSTS